MLVNFKSLTEKNQKFMFTHNQTLRTLKQTNDPAENLGKENVLKFIKEYKRLIIESFIMRKTDNK